MIAFLTFDCEVVPKFELSDPDYPRFNDVLTINGQKLLAFKIHVPLIPMQTDRQTVFYMILHTYSRGDVLEEILNGKIVFRMDFLFNAW